MKSMHAFNLRPKCRIQLYWPAIHANKAHVGISVPTVLMFNRYADGGSFGFQVLGFGAGVAWWSK